jgi:hypothetical protein
MRGDRHPAVHDAPSSSLRRARWLVFGAWLLTLIPAVWLAFTQSGHLTGGGFEVAGSQSLNVQYQLEDHFPGEGLRRWRWSPRRGRTRPTPT